MDDAHSLSQLFGLDDEQGELWTPGEYAAILRHQLSVDVAELRSMTRQVEINSAAECSRTVGELILSNRPHIEDLIFLKDFAKRAGSNHQLGIPRNVAAVLYVIAVAKARRCKQEEISSLSDESLRHKLIWAKRQSWLGQPIRRLLNDLAGEEE